MVWELGWLLNHFQRESRCKCLQVKPHETHISPFVMLLELLIVEVTQNEVLLHIKEKGYLIRGTSLICFFPLDQHISPFTGKRLWSYTDFVTTNSRETCRKTRTHVCLSVMFCYNFPSRTQISRFLLDYMFLKKISEVRTSRKLAAVWEVKERNFYSPLQLRCRQQLTLSFSPLAHKGSWVITYD